MFWYKCQITERLIEIKSPPEIQHSDYIRDILYSQVMEFFATDDKNIKI